MDTFSARQLNSAAEIGASRRLSPLRSLIAIALLTAAALCSLASAQQDSSAAYSSSDSNAIAETRSKTRFSVGGAVVNSVTGEPVQRALVSIDNRQYAMTDTSGHFQVEGVPRGNVTISAEKPGFFNPEQTGSNQEPSVQLAINADLGNVLLKLMPQAVVTGRITSLSGMPLEDIPVRLYARKIVEGRAQWQAAGTAQSDEDGQFRLAELTPGEYCLSAGPEHKNLFAADAEEREATSAKNNIRPRGYPEVFYPNAPELASAAPINLGAGQQFQADFSLSEEPLYEISGTVLGAPNEGGVGWALFNSSGEQLNSLRVRAQGQKFFGFVPAGRYTLRFFSRSNTQQLAGTVPINVASNLSGIRAVLAPEISIPVDIRLDSGASPRPEHTLQAVVQLRPIAGGLDQNEFSSMPSQQGGAAITGVPPGTYLVEVQAFGSNYVYSATSGSTDLLNERLVVPNNSKVDPIEVTLRGDGAHVGGSVQSQAPGLVLLVPERPGTGEIKSAEITPGGSFSFDHVRPGDYFALALQQTADFEYTNPEILAPYLSRATHLTLAPRQETTVNLEMISAAK